MKLYPFLSCFLSHLFASSIKASHPNTISTLFHLFIPIFPFPPHLCFPLLSISHIISLLHSNLPSMFLSSFFFTFLSSPVFSHLLALLMPRHPSRTPDTPGLTTQSLTTWSTFCMEYFLARRWLSGSQSHSAVLHLLLLLFLLQIVAGRRVRSMAGRLCLLRPTSLP